MSALAAFSRFNVWDVAHLRATSEWLLANGPCNFTSFEARHGEGSYFAVVNACRNGASSLEKVGAIPPDLLEIVETYAALREGGDEAVAAFHAALRTCRAE